MPVDDLLVWAAETSVYGPRRPDDNVIHEHEQEAQSSSEHQPINGRPPSPAPKRVSLPKWYEIGHCAAACSNRCSLHAGQPEPQDMAYVTKGPLESVNESPQTRQRHHRRHERSSFQWNDNPNPSPYLSSSSAAKPKKSERIYRNSRLEFAREQLLVGNVHVARAIVAEEMERLSQSEAR